MITLRNWEETDDCFQNAAKDIINAMMFANIEYMASFLPGDLPRWKVTPTAGRGDFFMRRGLKFTIKLAENDVC